MKFTCSVEIDQPIKRVIQLFDNPANMKEWQDGFVSMELLSGVRGKVGAKSRLLYKSGKHVVELIETIQVKNLPQEKTALYEHKHMVNIMSNYFTALGTDKTKWEVVIEYTKFIGFFPKLMALLMPGVFKKQTQKWLDQFKKFAETK